MTHGSAGAGSAAPLASVLRTLRTAALLTQEQLAERAGLSVRTIRNIESGRVGAPHGDTVRLLADALRLGDDDRARLERASRALPETGAAAVDQPAPPRPGAVRAAPAQLPYVTPDFIGRGAVEREAVRLVRGGDSASGARPVVLTGGPGVGKTALALHLAHGVRDAFPDGQLYVDLGGADPLPRDPAEVLAEFLRALGADAASVPSGLSARAGMYRAMLADRRVLVVLDDALDERQVRPLLPGRPPATVLVTSRRRLAALDGAHIVEVGVLEPLRARRLLEDIVGVDRVRADERAALAIVDHCGGLPLALRIAGALLRARPHQQLHDLAGRLGDEQQRLDTLAYSDLAVRASIGLTERGLSLVQRRAFGLVAGLPVTDFAASTAAAALDVPDPVATEVLDGLVEAHLLEVAPEPGRSLRYRFHELVRLYGREIDGDGERSAALARVLGRWLVLAEQADEALPGTSDVVVRGDAPRYPADDVEVAVVRAAPLDWFAAERRNIARAVEVAAEAGLAGYAWELAACLRTFAVMRSEWDLWQRPHEVALRACRAAGDLRGLGSMLVGLGKLRTDRHAVSGGPAEELTEARELFHRIGEAAGEAHALLELASFHEMTGDLARSVECAVRAVELARTASAADLEADALFVQGRALRRQGDHETAVHVLGPALDGYVARGRTRGAAQARWELAAVHRTTGDLQRADGLLRSCIVALQRIGDHRGEARVLIDLALTRHDGGRYDEAGRCLAEATQLCRAIGERSFLAQALDASARLSLDQDRLDEAAQAAVEAAEIWHDLGDLLHEEESLRLRDVADDLESGPQDGVVAR